MRYLFGSNLSKLSVLILIMLAACSLACAEDSVYSGDLSGQWNMVANTNYNFNLDLQQSGNQITGTMTRTNGASSRWIPSVALYPPTEQFSSPGNVPASGRRSTLAVCPARLNP